MDDLYALFQLKTENKYLKSLILLKELIVQAQIVVRDISDIFTFGPDLSDKINGLWRRG